MIYEYLAVGIDLGTTFSVVGVSVGGKVKIVEDKLGHRIFPSVVTYLDNGGNKIRPNKALVLDLILLCVMFIHIEIVASHKALPYMSTLPTATIFNAKRFIGRRSEL